MKQKIIYTAARPDQPVHNFHFDLSFCELIILEKEKHPPTHIQVKDFIEDTHVFSTKRRKMKVCQVVCLCCF